jgi:hypothetical protein
LFCFKYNCEKLPNQELFPAIRSIFYFLKKKAKVCRYYRG